MATIFAGLSGRDCNRNGMLDGCEYFTAPNGDANHNDVLDECERRGDVNGDGAVGFDDLLLLLSFWGPCDEPCPPTCSGDIDGNCQVGFEDLIYVLTNWGP